MKAISNKRLTIGLVIDSLRRSSGRVLWSSLVDYCKSIDIDLVILPGESLGSKNTYAYQHHIVYDFIKGETLDGLIIVANTLSDFLDKDTLNETYKSYLKVPYITLNLDIEGAVSTIHCDNTKGISNAMNHLIVQHGVSNIAFIGGQSQHQDAIERFDAYKMALEQHHLTYDSNLVVEGDFYKESGKKAVMELLDVRKGEFDAILASNDEMAIGALDELLRRGIRVPEDMKVIGFDDVEEIRFKGAPLASVRQPLKEMAKTAIHSLIRHINGETIARHQFLTPQYIPRASCGCVVSKETASKKTQVIVEYKNNMTIDFIVKEYCDRSVYNFKLVEKDFLEIINQLTEDCVETFEVDAILVEWHKKLRKEALTLDYILFWEGLYEVSKSKLLYSVEEKYTIRLVEYFFNEAYKHIEGLKVTTSGFNKIINNMHREHLMVESMDAIASVESIDELMDTLEKEFKIAGINTCAICLYETSSKNDDRIQAGKLPKRSKLKLGYNDQMKYVVHESFKTKRLIPKEMVLSDRPYAWVVEPLYFQNESYGYMIYEVAIKDGTLYESLRRQISITLHYLEVLNRMDEREWV